MSPRRGFAIFEGEEDLVKVESDGSRTDDDSTLELVGPCVEAAILSVVSMETEQLFHSPLRHTMSTVHC